MLFRAEVYTDWGGAGVRNQVLAARGTDVPDTPARYLPGVPTYLPTYCYAVAMMSPTCLQLAAAAAAGAPVVVARWYADHHQALVMM